MATPSPVCLIKKASDIVLDQNMQNDCHQWFSGSLSAPNSFSAEAPPRTPLGELTVLPRPPAGLRGPTSKGRGGEGERGGKGKKGIEGNRRGRDRPFYKFLVDPPLWREVRMKGRARGE